MESNADLHTQRRQLFSFVSIWTEADIINMYGRLATGPTVSSVSVSARASACPWPAAWQI